ncbi:MAG: hypothetical protein JO084_00295 [Bradyrhizobiaceae bacterium]|nr:hypothetical protein [Hyphomicrobiales bacterium]MBV9426147.1 hypothetical protein [Bradyrhizobiaceae bacterium]
MARARQLLLALVVLAAAGPAAAADPSTCLTQDQRRAAIATHRAIPLARAVRDIRHRTAGAEVVGARLCYRGSDLVYVLTVLARDGKVIRASVNAASGVLIDGY